MVDIKQWMAVYITAVERAFGDRVRYIGLQGSYGRGEATETSDIDPVLILDTLEESDLECYDAAVAALPERNLLCGFICGWEELRSWERGDLLLFLLDNAPIKGNLSPLLSLCEKADLRRAILTGACSIYHVCAHNRLHKKSHRTVVNQYKSAFFTIRAHHYAETGIHIPTRRELMEVVSDEEKMILSGPVGNISIDTARLLAWAGNVIRTYGG